MREGERPGIGVGEREKRLLPGGGGRNRMIAGAKGREPGRGRH